MTTPVPSKELMQIAETIERRPVLGHWPHMRAASDAEAVRRAAGEIERLRLREQQLSEALIKRRERIEHLQRENDTCGLQCSATMKSLMAEIELLKQKNEGSTHEPPVDPQPLLSKLAILKVNDELRAEVSALRHFAEWAKGAKCDDEYAPQMVKHIAAMAKDALNGDADIAGYPAGIGAGPPPGDSRADTERLDWMEKTRLHAVPFSERSRLDEDMEYLWWQIVDGKESISGHPLGTLREAIDAARQSLTKPGEQS